MQLQVRECQSVHNSFVITGYYFINDVSIIQTTQYNLRIILDEIFYFSYWERLCYKTIKRYINNNNNKSNKKIVKIMYTNKHR